MGIKDIDQCGCSFPETVFTYFLIPAIMYCFIVSLNQCSEIIHTPLMFLIPVTYTIQDFIALSLSQIFDLLGTVLEITHTFFKTTFTVFQPDVLSRWGAVSCICF